ncbi:MAG: RNA 2',3'-cyclic phosphodiesterase [Persephonella sp.]|nr:MAG: RNA 2',3'-cyclic phosphodiesterase [Persephonella sp.]
MKKRIFIGSFIKIIGLEEKYNDVKKSFDRYIIGRWTPLSNFHITYKFIGDVNEEELRNIHKILKNELDREINTEIQLKGLNSFPNIYNPKILFIDVIDKENFLTECSNLIEEKLSLLGYPKSDKKFIPHITLMRIKKYRKNKFIQLMRRFKDFEFGIQKQVEINIIESILKPDGAVYRKVSL